MMTEERQISIDDCTAKGMQALRDSVLNALGDIEERMANGDAPYSVPYHLRVDILASYPDEKSLAAEYQRMLGPAKEETE